MTTEKEVMTSTLLLWCIFFSVYDFFCLEFVCFSSKELISQTQRKLKEIDGNSNRCMNESPLVKLHLLVKSHRWKGNKSCLNPPVSGEAENRNKRWCVTRKVK